MKFSFFIGTFLLAAIPVGAEVSCDGLKLKCQSTVIDFTPIATNRVNNLNNSKCSATFTDSRRINSSVYNKRVEAGDSGVVEVDGSSDEYYFGQQRPPAQYQTVSFGYQIGVAFKIKNPTYGHSDTVECKIIK